MAYQQKTRPVRRAAPAVGRAASAVFAALARKTKFVEPAFADNWPDIAGPEIAGLCRPGRLTGGPKGGRTLEVYAPSGAEAAALQMKTGELIARVNRYLGTGAVAHIAIRQRSRAAPSPPAEDGESPLGKALASFRAAVSRRDKETDEGN